MRQKRCRNKIVLYSLLIATVVPILLAAIYGIPSADDFSNTLSWQTYEGSPLQYLLWNTVRLYKSWQGTYFGNFLASVPVYYEFGLGVLRFEMFLNAILFLVAVEFLVVSGLKKLMKGSNIEDLRYISLIVLVLALIYILSLNNLDEVFYWHTGICVYTLPLSLALLCIACFWNFETQKKKSKYLVAGIILAAFGAGGSLDVSAFLCAALLFGILYDFIIARKLQKNVLIGLTAFIGAVINAAAPGNFVRHDVIDTKIRVGQSIWETFERTSNVIAEDFTKGFLLLIIIVIFVAAYHRLGNSKMEFRYPGLVSLYCYLAIFITDFPVALGYSHVDLPVRCAFIEKIAIAFFLILAVIYWGGWAAKKGLYHFSREFQLVVTLICVISMSKYFGMNSLLELTPYKMIYHMVTGDFGMVEERERNVLNQIEDSSNADVIVQVERPLAGEWANIRTVGVTEDVANWKNAVIAAYYKKNTVLLQYIDGTGSEG